MEICLKVMEGGSLDGLQDAYFPKLKNLLLCLSFRDITDDDTAIAELKEINQLIDRLGAMNCEVRDVNIVHKGKITQLKALTAEMSKLEEKVKYMLDNIPKRMPRKQKEKQAEPSEMKTTREPLAQMTTSKQNQENQPVNTAPKSTKVSQSTMKPAPGKQVNVYVPEIDLLTVDEFDQIPKYQKGRLTYDQVNKFIDVFNEAYKRKYKIMKQKKSTMNDADRKRFEAYKSQENKDCKGCYFVVDEDLKDFGGVKLDSTARTICTILRHCGRIKEIRGGNLTRYKYVDRY